MVVKKVRVSKHQQVFVQMGSEKEKRKRR
uniref:Uncharacterized protein n=1 Tax=Anguilla anguilla TaxID=7936 RepID=A0A0E9WG25_ANGAN